ncbi:cysteine desulfurase NifS [Leptolyngbyaceae cyanobacterium CCMR0082]|uniref:Cysteine desulfurase n=2 Tax=Adonisia turfae TaxID=2950184 RepID=A0A6M0RYV6_9CYAN|nr:cysteine desulfurase NifS [Adonisia turfae]NEZ56929.1 cysteine desulfurase NifS [Adonisia turfae CCMR0081]NEZ61398.1 cysteine desulfurase NifS [Adonisia turfae CCMR0082]
MVIYLDNNATTRVDPDVLDAMLPYLSDLYGNPSSMHSFGGQVGAAIQDARVQVAELLGAEDTEIIFTSCGSEGNNTAIHAALAAQPEKRHIVTTAVEHPAILNVCKHLEKKGYTVTYLSVDRRGQLDLMEVEAAMTGGTALVTTMYANNETGVIFPIEQVGAIAKECGATFHVDAVQAVGKLPIDLKNSTIDLLTLSGHKLHAPKGVGALYVRRGFRFRPFLLGGHQERGRRAGTHNVPGIIALGKAAAVAREHLAAVDRECQLRDQLERQLLELIPDCDVNGGGTPRLPNTTNIGFKYIEGEAILFMLNQHGICASSGSACTSGSLDPSHVLTAMGLPYTILHGSIRFSLSRFTTAEDIQQVVNVMPGIVEKLRAISPFNNDEADWLQGRDLVHSA